MTTERKLRLDARAVLLLLLCCALWGLGQVATKLALVEIPPLMQAAARSVGAAMLLGAWMRWRGLLMPWRDGSFAPGLAAGVLFALEFACLFAGLQFTTASRMVVFLYTAPFVVALGMPFIAQRENLNAVQWAGLLLAFAGVVWAFAEGFGGRATAGDRQWLGDALGLGAALAWAATTLMMRGTALARIAPERTLLYQLVVSAALLALASALAGEPWPSRLTAASLWSLTFQVVVITFFTYLSWFWLLRHYPATQVSAFTLLTPLLGLLAGAWILHEPLTARLVLAMVAVCLGIALVSLAPRRA
jgi:drug/metabolite transporter (DMT)-like permease